MTTPDLAIEYLPIGQLSPYVRNSRTHSDDQVQAIARSISNYGFTQPVLVDADGGIIAGHGRVRAAQKIGLQTVPCIRLAHLTDAQKRAYVIADNRLYDMGGWDMATLASEVEDLLIDSESDIELADLGFDDDAFAALAPHLGAVGLGGGVDLDGDLVPEDREGKPTADDYADIGHGAATPGEGKSLRYPVVLQLDKATWSRWRKDKGKRSDSEAIAALLELRRLVTEYLPVEDPADIEAVSAAFSDMAADAAAAPREGSE